MAAVSAVKRFSSLCHYLNILSPSEDQPPALLEVQSFIAKVNRYARGFLINSVSSEDIFHSDTILNISDLHPKRTIDSHRQFFLQFGPAEYHKYILRVRDTYIFPIPTILLVEHKKSLKPYNPLFF